MFPVRLTLAALGLSTALLVSSCSMFSSSPPSQTAGQQEYDTMSNSWKPSTRVIVPPPAQPATPMKVASAEPEKKDGVLTKVGNTVKKPLGWLPFVGKK